MSKQKTRKQDAAIGIIFNSDRTEILVIQRLDVNVWVLPGGGIDPGETAEEAAIREVQEETGLHVRIVRKVAEYTPVNRLAAFTHLFECEVRSGTLSQNSETRNLGFFSIKALPKNFFPLHHDWLLDALENASYIIQKPISRITYFEIMKYFCLHPWMVVRFLLTRLGYHS